MRQAFKSYSFGLSIKHRDRADTRSGTDSKFSSSCVGRAGGMIWTWFDYTTHAQTT